MNAALTRYRIAAYVVGVMLLVLVFIAMPIKYFGDNPAPVQVIGPIHGWLFAIYLVLAFDLARRTDWPLKRTLGVMIAGTIPFLSFVVERKVRRWLAPAVPAVDQGTGSGAAAGGAETSEITV
jgi:integral membrane protein